MGTITGVRTKQRVAALTFDDGPDPRTTPAILDVLERHGVRATFFMLGMRAAAYPDLCFRIEHAGHAIANHSWAHRSFVLEAPKGRAAASRWRRELIRRSAEALGPGSVPLFRPPYGHQNFQVRIDAHRAGDEVIGWNVSAGDWTDDDPDAIVRRVRDQLRPGAIVLWHDALADAYAERYFDRSNTITALDRFLELEADHYRLVPLPELLTCGPAVRRFFYPRPSRDSLPSVMG